MLEYKQLCVCVLCATNGLTGDLLGSGFTGTHVAIVTDGIMVKDLIDECGYISRAQLEVGGIFPETVETDEMTRRGFDQLHIR